MRAFFLLVYAEDTTAHPTAGGVGKSALTIRFGRNVFIDQYNPTIEGRYSPRNQRLFD